MRPSRKLLLTFLAIGLVPLLLLASFNYWNGLRVAEKNLQQSQKHDLDHFSGEIAEFLGLNQAELIRLSRGKPLVDYLGSSTDDIKVVRSTAISAPNGNVSDIPHEVQAQLTAILNGRTNISSVAIFKSNQGPFLVAEQREFETYQPVNFHTSNFPLSQVKPDERVWTSQGRDVINSPVSLAPYGSYMLSTVPIFSNGAGGNSLLGALVAEIRMDRVFFEAARADKSLAPKLATMFVVTDRSGKAIYHTSGPVADQQVDNAMPQFPTAVTHLFTGERGEATFLATNGTRYSTAYSLLPAVDVFVTQVSNVDAALADAHRAGQRGLLLATLLGVLAVGILAAYWQTKIRGIQRVSEGVEAMARGKLDHHIDLRSRDDLKPMADNLEVMTRQMREQMAREAETQQFQSFVRLSAILTHDLKNAIESLSLTVSNMERHSENPEFRIDAMKTLRGATENLKALVARLSSPVTTLSGEHKLPRSVDLVPMLRRVISTMAVSGPHALELKLPNSLLALVDIERMDKVIENLIINAREAMAGKNGTITVEAGLTTDDKPFFSVSDTGEGMSRRFIEQHLFRPFATTKRHGVGLGLYTCKEVVRANGGSIEVRSQAGVGTTFLVVLPSPPTDEGREIALRAHHLG